MAWFKRSQVSISTDSQGKDVPEGLWVKCNSCGEIIHKKQLEHQWYTCIKCNYHFRIGSKEYINLLIDNGTFEEFDKKMRSADPLKFKDYKEYKDRIKETIRKTGLYDAIRTGKGKINGIEIILGVMDFDFIGGSMGSVVGEKVTRAINMALKKEKALIIISSSGGARMMEGAISLMQLAKTSAKLTQLSDAAIPYISVLTDPTTGGVAASYGMLGDIIIAEPGALIGFAGPRVIRQTIGKDLPEGFQRAEFQLEHGFVDMVVHRKDMKEMITRLLNLILE